MWTRTADWRGIQDVEQALAAMDGFRRRSMRVAAGRDVDAWPGVTLVDRGEDFLAQVQVPGMSLEDVHVTLEQDVLTLSGERKTAAPEGFSVRRKERTDARFSRSFQLPEKVDGDKTTASFKNGVLTVTLPKAAQPKARSITIQPQ